MRLYVSIPSSLLLMGLLAPSAVGQDAPPLTNKDVIEMTQAGLPEDTILMSVQTAAAEFSTGAQDLIALQKSNVSNAVIKAMIARNADPAASPPVTGMPPGVVVMPVAPLAVPNMPIQPVAIDGEKRVGLKVTAHDYKYDHNKRTGLDETTDETHVVLSGESSDVRIGSGALAFEVPLEGVRARPEQQLFLLRLDVKRGARLALTERKVESEFVHGTTLLGGGAAGYVATAVAANAIGALFSAAKAKRNKGLESVVRIKFSEVSDTGMGGIKIFKVTPEEPLTAGEYALLWEENYWDFGVD